MHQLYNIEWYFLMTLTALYKHSMHHLQPSWLWANLVDFVYKHKKNGSHNNVSTFCIAYMRSDIAASVMSRSISVQCCIHFPATPVGMTGESGHWAKLVQHIPNVLTGVKVWTLVADPCVKTMSHHPWTTPSQSESDESWHWRLEICLQGRNSDE